MPEHPFFPELLAEIGHRGPRATIHCGGNMGPFVSGKEEARATEALAAEALATDHVPTAILAAAKEPTGQFSPMYSAGPITTA
jgi:hypothetical protein